jgi:hypothetical protein
VLAAIGKVETNYGRLQAPGVTSGANFAGAAGPMQIGIGKAGNTFGAYAVDGDGDGISNVYNPADAIFTAASYLCRNGGGKGGDLSRAVFAYNQLGKPYVWGAEGDNFYDCSGLMQRAYKEAGVQLPRTSASSGTPAPGLGPRPPSGRRSGVRGEEPLRPEHDLPRRHVHRRRQHDRGPLHRRRGPHPADDPERLHRSRQADRRRLT